MSRQALTNSELIAIYDEADFLLQCGQGINDEYKNECMMVHDNESITNLKSEFIHRIAYIYNRELDRDYDEVVYNRAMRFFINEAHILFTNKYGYADNLDLKWSSYTDEYYKFFKY